MPLPPSRTNHCALPWLQRISRPLTWLVAVLVIVVIVWSVEHIRRGHSVSLPAQPKAAADPRLSYSGPYLNVYPDVKYVGDTACADCHQKESESYHHHPMGRSILSVNDPGQRALERGHGNPFSKLGSEFHIERAGDRLRHREARRDTAGRVLYESVFDVQYVVGSGNHGHSYLAVRDGFVFQTPVSWYSSKQIWDLAPGWTSVEGGRAIVNQCLYCHADRVGPVAGTINRYAEPLFAKQAAIGCERCHGPGERHVATGGAAFTIVNPKKLEPDLREAVCQQCHLEGESRMTRRGRRLFDFRPGLPLGEFLAVFVDADLNNPNAVNHVEQMKLSRCYQGSGGQLGCISCHDPHVKPLGDERIAHFRNRCLTCHETRGCSVAEATRRQTSKQDSCIDCHMPRTPTADIVHTASFDHRVPRKPFGSGKHEAQAPTQLPIRSFFPQADDRDLGLALVDVVRLDKVPLRFARDALTHLDAALAKDDDDAEAHEGRARALGLLNRRRDAAEAFAAALRLEPKRESALAGAAELAMVQDRRESAIELWRRAIEVSPYRPHYHGNLALLLTAAGDWPAARDAAATCVRLDPAQAEVRAALIESLLRLGEVDKAKAQFAILDALATPNQELYRRRFAARLR